MAGPIERASHLVPQFLKKRTFNSDHAVDGMRQILWGLFKKIVIADNCAFYVNSIYNNTGDSSGSSLALAAILFSFQIYCDFSGYSDIAIGTSRLFGFDLMKNFNFPYFSRDIAEFWRRWHISLSTWFRDYLYIPLGGSQGGLKSKIKNTFIIFIVSGFWHGANWTFIFWGFLNALFFLPLLLSGKNRKHVDAFKSESLFKSTKEIFQIILTFGLTSFAWVFFRADTISEAFYYILGIFSNSLFSVPENFPTVTITLVVLFIGAEWLQKNKNHGLEFLNGQLTVPARWMIYLLLCFLILMFGGTQQEFIYFQF